MEQTLVVNLRFGRGLGGPSKSRWWYSRSMVDRMASAAAQDYSRLVAQSLHMATIQYAVQSTSRAQPGPRLAAQATLDQPQFTQRSTPAVHAPLAYPR